MMNFFMEESSNQGVCGEDQNLQNQILVSTSGGKLPFFSSSSTSSSSSSSYHLHRSLHPLSFLHHHQQPIAEEMGSMRSHTGGASKLEFMEEDASTTCAEEDHSNDGRRGSGIVEREHMFDKVVTPSDVGKLNRLVIPKQHAEKYFPLDSSTNEKGLLLNFEDRNGKPWRFRYSYWNSSQSYVMTKGWSRFVKEKKLDAGDIVSFQRGVGELGKDRLFIDWRRRPDAPDHLPPSHLPHHYFSFQRSSHSHSWTPLLLQPHPPPPPPPPPSRDHLHFPHLNATNYPSSHSLPATYAYSYNYGGVAPYTGAGNSLPSAACSSSVIYLRSASAAAARQQGGMVQMQSRGGGGGGGGGSGGVEPVLFGSVPVVQGKAAAKRLRLFGVNMDCPISESDGCDILSSTTIPFATMPTSPVPPLQLRLYNGSPVPAFHSDDKPSNLSNTNTNSKPFDLDI